MRAVRLVNARSYTRVYLRHKLQGGGAAGVVLREGEGFHGALRDR
jgi:hypothetical protein